MTEYPYDTKIERLEVIGVGWPDTGVYQVLVDGRAMPWSDWDETSAANHIAALRYWLASEESD